MDILRFITAGNVDDGKSTLIGRLLYDTNNIKKDVLQSVADTEPASSAINLAFITDGLREERRHGITIDVAYKYFTTKTRKYIITDAPGHFEFTRNLVTGASGADLMIILIDAKNGITDQTRRHSLVASFLRINKIIVAVNKMDLVAYDVQVFDPLKKEFCVIAEKLRLSNVTFIPVSALLGDNVSFPSVKMKWYKGETLMQYLEDYVPPFLIAAAARFSTQYIINGTERGFAGKMLSGKLKVNEEVIVYPKGNKAMIRRIVDGDKEVNESYPGQNICVFLENDVEVNRGDIIGLPDGGPICSNEFEATICWLNGDAELQLDTEYYLRINALETKCVITQVLYKTDVSSLEKYKTGEVVAVNQFARVRIKTTNVITYDLYEVIPENGRGIIIDAQTNYTSAAFII